MKKRLLAFAMSAIMLFGVTTTAFAANRDADGNLIDQSTVTITKNYELSGSGSSPAETFTLTQVGDGTVTNSEATSAPALGTITGAAFAAGDAGTGEAASKTFTIELPTYTNTGIYTYTLKETKGSTAGVTYHEEEIKLVVTVINDADGLMRVAAVHTEDSTGTKTDVFKNTYTANDLKVKKTVAGNLGDKNKEFEFTVTFAADENTTWTNAITAPDDKVTWNGNVAAFKLKHDDDITFGNIPSGVRYVVEEKDADGYTVKYDANKEGTMAGEAISTTVTNTKDGQIDTGINLDSMPYILTIIAIAGAAIVFAISRKREIED